MFNKWLENIEVKYEPEKLRNSRKHMGKDDGAD